MARKGWDNLSAGYRNRIAKAGLTREDYERGQSLRKARGHEHTPERPTSYDPKKYPKYDIERKKLINEIQVKKQRMFGLRPKWNPQKSRDNIIKYFKTMQSLRFWSQSDEQDWLHAIREDPTVAAGLGYH